MEKQWLAFDGYAFPVLPNLVYHPDGPDKARPDRLFIEDREKRFLLYLEAGGPEPAPASAQESDYDTLTLFYHSRRLELVYPLQKACPGITLGYFYIQLPGGNPARPCAGSLSIAEPKGYWEGLWQYEDLAALFSGLRLLEEQQPIPERQA